MTQALWPFPWHVTPSTPDLGCFVQNKHPFETDGTWYWNEYPPYDAAGYIPHQCYLRVKCGHADYHQRVKVWMSQGSAPPPFLTGQPPAFVLGGAFAPTPGDWVSFPVQSGETYYWFVGEHKPPTAADWRRDAGVGHSFDIYDRGTLSTVGWDDTGEDRDYDDFVLEVAVVHRRGFLPDHAPFPTETAQELLREIEERRRRSPKAKLA